MKRTLFLLASGALLTVQASLLANDELETMAKTLSCPAYSSATGELDDNATKEEVAKGIVQEKLRERSIDCMIDRASPEQLVFLRKNANIDRIYRETTSNRIDLMGRLQLLETKPDCYRRDGQPPYPFFAIIPGLPQYCREGFTGNGDWLSQDYTLYAISGGLAVSIGFLHNRWNKLQSLNKQYDDPVYPASLYAIAFQLSLVFPEAGAGAVLINQQRFDDLTRSRSSVQQQLNILSITTAVIWIYSLYDAITFELLAKDTSEARDLNAPGWTPGITVLPELEESNGQNIHYAYMQYRF